MTDLTRYLPTKFPNDYQFLGEEAFGDVYRADLKFMPQELRSLRSSGTVAIQLLRIPPQLGGAAEQSERWQQLQSSANVWKTLDHGNVLRIFGIAKVMDQPSIITPFLASTDVRSYFKARPEVSKLPILLGIAKGLSYLHSLRPGVVHGGVAPENVLIDDGGNPRLTQFGLASLMEDGTLWSTTATRPRTRVRYTSPELLELPEVSYTMPADIYAYAMTCYEIVTGRPPFDEYDNVPALLAAIVFEKKRPKRRLYLNMDPKLWALWGSCWAEKPGDRLNATQVLERMNDAVNNPTPIRPAILASGSLDGTVRLWNVVTGLLSNELPGLPKIDRESLACSADGKKLFVASVMEDKKVVHLDVATNKQEWSMPGCSCAAYSPNPYVASGSQNAEVHIYKVLTGEVWSSIPSSGTIYSIKFSPSGAMLAFGCQDRSVRVWDGATRTLGGHGGPAWSVAFSPDGKQLASGCRDKIIRVWDVTNWNLIHQLTAEDTVRTIAFSPDSKKMVSGGGKGGGVRLWNMETGTPLWTMTEHAEFIQALAFSTDGSLIASASADKTICIWDVESGEAFYVLKGHTMEVTSLVFLPVS